MFISIFYFVVRKFDDSRLDRRLSISDDIISHFATSVRIKLLRHLCLAQFQDLGTLLGTLLCNTVY